MFVCITHALPHSMIARLVVLCLCPWVAFTAPMGGRSPAMDSLIILQDLRTATSAFLVRHLHANDAHVVEQSALAAANVQDTSVLGDLVPLLRSPRRTIRESAALALGQIVPLCSPSRRAEIEVAVIECLAHAPTNDRLVEECGKFGDTVLLNVLAARTARTPAASQRSLFLGMARFAIRGIRTPLSERALIHACSNASHTPWEAVYALQRAGNQSDVRNSFDSLEALVKSSDPLVRMNLALLAGKLRDYPPALQVIERLLTDHDWRVRVNAVRSLVQWPDTNPGTISRAVSRCLYDPDPHVAIALVTSLEGARPLILWLARGDSPMITTWLDSVARLQTLPVRGLRPPVLNVLARIQPEKAVPLLATMCDRESPATPDAIGALGRTGSKRAFPLLFHYWERFRIVTGKPPQGMQLRALAAVLDGIGEWIKLRDSVLHTERDSIETLCIEALQTGDVALVANAADLLSSQALRDPNNIPAFQKVLAARKMPADIESAQALVGLLRALGDSSAAVPVLPIVEPVGPSNVFALPDTVHITLETSKGAIRAELFTTAAPFTVANFIALAEEGFFTSSMTRPMQFHRVVPNFVVQGGDPRGDGWGGPGFSLRTEISPLRFETGSLGMASAGRDTEGSQFFVTHSPQPHLDGRYTVFGKVIRGMDIVDQLQVGDSLLSVTIAR